MRVLRASVILGFIVGLSLALSPAISAQGDPLLGRWMLNVAKSKFTPGPAPKSEMRTYEAFGGAGKGITLRIDRVDATGNKIAISFSAMYDGKDYKYNGPDADTIMLMRPNPNTVDATLKLKGKVVQTAHGVVSADGKTRTQTTTGTDAKGQKYNNVTVFEKQ